MLSARAPCWTRRCSPWCASLRRCATRRLTGASSCGTSCGSFFRFSLTLRSYVVETGAQADRSPKLRPPFVGHPGAAASALNKLAAQPKRGFAKSVSTKALLAALNGTRLLSGAQRAHVVEARLRALGDQLSDVVLVRDADPHFFMYGADLDALRRRGERVVQVTVGSASWQRAGDCDARLTLPVVPDGVVAINIVRVDRSATEAPFVEACDAAVFREAVLRKLLPQLGQLLNSRPFHPNMTDQEKCVCCARLCVFG